MALVRIQVDTQNPDRPAELEYPVLYVGRNNLYFVDEAKIIGQSYRPNLRTMSTPEVAELAEILNFRWLGLMEEQEEPEFVMPERWPRYRIILEELFTQTNKELERRAADMDVDAVRAWNLSDAVENPRRLVFHELQNRCFVLGLKREKLCRVRRVLEQQILETQETVSALPEGPLRALLDYRRRIRECFLAEISVITDEREEK